MRPVRREKGEGCRPTDSRRDTSGSLREDLGDLKAGGSADGVTEPDLSNDLPEVVPRRSDRGYLIAKRLLDLVLAGGALIAASPLIVMIVVAIRLGSPGPGFYRQRRVGKDGRSFTMYKFRSMYDNQGDGPHRQAFQRYRHGMPLADRQFRDPYKLHEDARITPMGHFLRRTSLDELPQLWNIVRGAMSLVGPRPPIPYEVELYEPHHLRRLSVTPGLTGLWQVRGRSRTTFEEMVVMDLEYIAKQSFLLDLKILLATVPAVLKREGAG